MPEDIKNVLVDKDGLQVVFLVEEGDARIEIRGDERWDLQSEDDIIIFLNDQHVPANATSADLAVATIGDWSQYQGAEVSLVIRIHEFFEAWELEG